MSCEWDIHQKRIEINVIMPRYIIKQSSMREYDGMSHLLVAILSPAQLKLPSAHNHGGQVRTSWVDNENPTNVSVHATTACLTRNDGAPLSLLVSLVRNKKNNVQFCVCMWHFSFLCIRVCLCGGSNTIIRTLTANIIEKVILLLFSIL